MTHLIVYSSYFIIVPGCATDAPVFMFTILPKKITTSTRAPSVQKLDLHLRCAQMEPLDPQSAPTRTPGLCRAHEHVWVIYAKYIILDYVHHILCYISERLQPLLELKRKCSLWLPVNMHVVSLYLKRQNKYVNTPCHVA